MSQGGTDTVPEDLQSVLLGQLPVPVLACAVDGSVIYANAAAAAWFDCTTDILIATTIELLLPEWAPEAWTELLESLCTGSTKTLQVVVQRPDGSRRSASLTAQLTRSEQAEYCTLLFTGPGPALECTQMHRFAQAALELAPIGVYWIRRDGTLMYVNQAACDMLGYSRDELLSLNMLALNQDMTPDRWSQVWQALAQQTRRTFSSAHRARGGRMVPVEISARMFDLDDEQFSCAFSRDMTDLHTFLDAHRREHAFLESLVDAAPVMIGVVDADGQLVRFNRYAEKVTGFTFDDIRGERWREVLIPGQDGEDSEQLLREFMSGAKGTGVVRRLKTKSGEVREIVWNAQLLASTDTHGVGLLLVGLDISEQRELEERLQQAEKMEAIGRLAGGVAHDFNNQLTGIIGWTEILRLETHTSAAVECIDRILLASKRASDLTSQLLAYSRKGKFVTQPVDLHVIVREAVAILSRSIDKRISVVLDLQAPHPRTVGDATQLGNVVLNLALNARDAMPEGGELMISTRVVEGEARSRENGSDVTPGEFIELTVRDSGTGITEEVQRRMFEPFFTTKQEGRGTGMGLAAVYGAVKNHRGTISVASTVGHGTQVRILLPLGVPEEDRTVKLGRTDRASVAPLRVMVVEDEESVRELTARLLRHLGCQVVAVENGFQAVEHYSSAWASVDLVILDMVMPILDGKSTYYALRRINPDVRIILMSGYSVDGATQALLDDGALAFIRKPFTLEMLADAVSRVPNIGPSSVHEPIPRDAR